ncbi:MAG: B12-binding domain-containing radical SAM protein [Promethearchaeota archaeon]
MKNVVRDLLYGCWCRGERIAGATFPPQSLLSIYTILEKIADVKLLDYIIYDFDLHKFTRLAQFFDWIIIPSSYQTLHDDLIILKLVKENNPKIKTILFGAVTTFSPEVIKYPEIDFGIMGEPEFAIYSLIDLFSRYYNDHGPIIKNGAQNTSSSYYPNQYQFLDQMMLYAMEKNTLFNLGYATHNYSYNYNYNNYNTDNTLGDQHLKQGTSKGQNIPNNRKTKSSGEEKLLIFPRKYVNLDDLPIPDRTPILNYSYFNPLTETTKWTTILSSRGCPNKCIFCTSPAFYGNRFRYNSPEYTLREIKYLLSLGYKELFFRDETFTMNKRRVKRLCNLINAEGLEVKWICNSRVDTIDEDLLSNMKKAGCHTIKFGVESGNQRILDLLKKGITLEQTQEAFNLCHKYGVKTHAHVILGSPTETIGEIMKTIKFIKELKPSTVTFNIFTAFPGAPIFYETNPEYFNVNDKYLQLFETKSAEFFAPTNSSDKEKIVRDLLLPYAYKKFYLRPSYILNKLKTIRNFRTAEQLVRSALNIFSLIFNRKNRPE